MKIQSFTFGPFAENTYILYDSTHECVIVDPGCTTVSEEKELEDFILKNQLKPVRLLNTHTHIDHITGNYFIYKKYGLKPEFCKEDLPTFRMAAQAAQLWGIPYTPSPEPGLFIKEGDIIAFGNQKLEIVFTPGHSHGGICFINHLSQDVIAGDILFNGSIGRTDLPGGDFDTLINSIKQKLLVLPHSYDVYPGHGPKTTIGYEREYNPFLS